MRGFVAHYQPSNLDYARIRIDNPYWRQHRPGGYLVDVNSANTVLNAPAILTYSINLSSSIDINDYVCLVALSPDADDACGRISAEYATYSMAQVEYDACIYDSGGAWVWRNSDGGLWGLRRPPRRARPAVPKTSTSLERTTPKVTPSSRRSPSCTLTGTMPSATSHCA